MTGRLTFIVIAAIANFGLGLFVYLKNPPKAINRHFAFFSFAVAAWTLSNGLVSSYAGSESGYVWARFAFASASLIPITFLWFADVFPTSQPYASPRILKYLLAWRCSPSTLRTTPLTVRDLSDLLLRNKPVHPHTETPIFDRTREAPGSLSIRGRLDRRLRSDCHQSPHPSCSRHIQVQPIRAALWDADDCDHCACDHSASSLGYPVGDSQWGRVCRRHCSNRIDLLRPRGGTSSRNRIPANDDPNS